MSTANNIYFCLQCKNTFSPRRSKQLYCSHPCSAKAQIETKRDDFSSFRKLLSTARGHVRKWRNANIRPELWDFNLTVEDLAEQWKKQKGKCPYTGWKMSFRIFKGPLRNDSDIAQASLDRIDSNVGYEPGNIQFISLIAQYAKNNWDEEVIYQFATAVVKNDRN